MIERAAGPSRLVQAVARWAITLGAGGTMVGGAAIYPVLLGEEVAGNRHGILMLAGILLSLSFVLAPFVRRTFGKRPAARAAPAQRTLLDEMREAPPGETGTELAAETAAVAAAPEADAVAPGSSIATRVVTAAYAVFAATLLVVLWMLQTT
jgi:hypothetical protein